MLGTELHGPVQFCQPIVRRLAGQGMDQIDTDVGKPGSTRRRKRVDRLPGRMYPAQQRQHFVIKRLHPERQAVYPSPPVSGKADRGKSPRIGFEGYLGIACKTEQAAMPLR